MWAKQLINPHDWQSFIRDSRDYTLLNGLVIRSNQSKNDNCVVHVPFTPFPSPFPRELYTECLNLQPTINTLLCKLANDLDFLVDVLRPVSKADEFTKNLLDINAFIVKKGRAQPIISCISRSDYMLHRELDGSMGARQVEVNTMASSMSAHSSNVKELHKYLYSKYNIKLPNGCSMPENGSLDLVAHGIIDAFDAYKQATSYVLLLTEERSLNFSDQHLIELRVHKIRPDIKFLRKRFKDMPSMVSLGPNNELLIDSKEIALVYFRCGYDPSDYNFEEAWAMRLTIERSRAIKCPSINFHLAGAKKFQQVLNSAPQLERYLDASSSKRLANVFSKIWSLDTDDFKSSEQYRMIKDRSRKFVLKPQREGGGHNIFGDQIGPFVESPENSGSLSQYILMEYIDSPQEQNWLFQQGQVDDLLDKNLPDKMISELGIFGSILANGPQMISDRSAGYLVRSKKFGVDEGGVAMGYAGISNLLLVDQKVASDFFV